MGAEFVSIDAQFFGKKFDDDLNGTLEEFNLNFSSFISAPRSTRSVQISDFKLGLDQIDALFQPKFEVRYLDRPC